MFLTLSPPLPLPKWISNILKGYGEEEREEEEEETML